MIVPPFWGTRPDAAEGPLYPGNVWDTLFFWEMQVPGICRVQATLGEKVDEQKGSGTDGAVVFCRGRLPGVIRIDIELWTPDQWRRWGVVFEQIWRNPHKDLPRDRKREKKPRKDQDIEEQAREAGALRVFHPALAAVGVTFLVLKEMGTPEDGQAFGVKRIRMSAIEWIPPPQGGAKNATRKIVGPSLDPAILDASGGPKNHVPPKPSTTDGVPVLPPKPKEGRF